MKKYLGYCALILIVAACGKPLVTDKDHALSRQLVSYADSLVAHIESWVVKAMLAGDLPAIAKVPTCTRNLLRCGDGT